MTQFYQVGDHVDQDTYDYLLEVLPPITFGRNHVQCSETCDHRGENGRARYTTIARRSEALPWVYLGERERGDTTIEPCFVVVDPAASAENTSGHMGTLTLGNVYLSTYADYSGHPHPSTLARGQRTQATFRLSGEKGTYDIVRVS